MIKYLFFILIGIILYILSNNKDGFNIGVPEYQFTIEGEEINLSSVRDDGIMAVEDDPVYQDATLGENTIYVYGKDENDARRKLKRHIDLNTDGATLVDIRLTTPVIDVDQDDDDVVVCEPNYRCIIGETSLSKDVSFDYCDEQFQDVPLNCMMYHINNYCEQNCSFVISNNASKTLDNDGFQYLRQLVDDLNPELSFTRLEYSNTGLLYSEYLFKLFIERINPGSNLHKFGDGIYFINGKIVICRFTSGQIRIINIRTTIWSDLTDEQRIAAGRLNWDEDTWNNQIDTNSLFVLNWGSLTLEQQTDAITLRYDESTWGKDPPYHKYYTTRELAFPLLHMDLQKYITYDDRANPYDDRANQFGTMRGPMINSQDGHRGTTTGVDGKTSKYHFISRLYENGILFNTNEKSKSINLWLLLEGSQNVKTMGFIDIIDDVDSDKYNADTLRDMQRNDLAIQRIPVSNIFSMVEYPDRLTPYFQTYSVQFPNVLNMQTSDNTLDPTKPNINPNILHTYDMTPGDVLAFRSDIPHLGFKDVRTSVEYRYDYVEIDVYDYMKDLSRGGSCTAQLSSELAHLYVERDEIENKLKEFLDPDDDDILLAISDKINLNFQLIFSNFQSMYIDNMATDKYSNFNVEMFKNLLNVLNSKPTLNLNDNSTNPEYSDNLIRLRTYIEEFLRTLD